MASFHASGFIGQHISGIGLRESPYLTFSTHEISELSGSLASFY